MYLRHFLVIYFIGRYKETCERATSSENFKLYNAHLQNKAGTHMLLTKQVFKLTGSSWEKTIKKLTLLSLLLKGYCKHTTLCLIHQIIFKSQSWENAKQPEACLPKEAKQTKNKNKLTQQRKSLD